jgi:hypothetical protein
LDRCKQVTLVIAALGLLGTGSQATAGTRGSISRGMVSISITIAPHIQIRPAAETGTNASDAAGLCLQTNGFHNFHVAVIRAATTADNVSRALLIDARTPAGDLAHCPATIPLEFDLRDQGRMGEPSPDVPMTLLIVPD